MKISARNVFKGSIATIVPGSVNTEVAVAIAGGDTLTAIVTNSSAQSLGLAKGKEVVALIKASSVLLMTDDSGIRLSARNCLKGKVKSVTPGAVNSEVTLTLAGGGEIHAIVTCGAVQELGLAPGVSVIAVIKASSVILGVLT